MRTHTYPIYTSLKKYKRHKHYLRRAYCPWRKRPKKRGLGRWLRRHWRRRQRRLWQRRKQQHQPWWLRRRKRKRRARLQFKLPRIPRQWSRKRSHWHARTYKIPLAYRTLLPLYYKRHVALDIHIKYGKNNDHVTISDATRVYWHEQRPKYIERFEYLAPFYSRFRKHVARTCWRIRPTHATLKFYRHIRAWNPRVSRPATALRILRTTARAILILHRMPTAHGHRRLKKWARRKRRLQRIRNKKIYRAI